MTIPRDLSNLAPGANTSGVLQPSKGGTGLTSPGTNGNVLTSNGTAWVSSAPSSAGSGGATATGNVTLTSASSGAQSITTTAFGQSVTLPNATTMSKAANLFSIENVGPYPLRVKSSTGNTLGFIYPQEATMVGLSDNSTAAGVWNLSNIDPIAQTASYTSTTIYNLTRIREVRIDSDRLLFTYGNGSSNLYAQLYNETTQTWGTPTLVRSSAGYQIAIVTGANQALVCSCDTTTGFQAVVLTFSGTTITVGTAATATNGSSFTKFHGIISVGSSYIVSYGAGSNNCRAMTISGTTVTIGSEVAQTGANLSYTFPFSVSSTVFFVSSISASATLYVNAYTVSGTTITATPGVGATVGASESGYRVLPISNGARWAFAYVYTGNNVHVTILTMTGSTPSFSTAVDTSVAITAGSVLTSQFDMVVSGSKLILASNGATPRAANIVTDTSGTGSAGTALTIPLQANYLFAVFASSNVAQFVTSNGNFTLGGRIGINYSGSSPTLETDVNALPGTAGYSFVGTFSSASFNSNFTDRKSGNWMYGTVNYCFYQPATTAIGEVMALQGSHIYKAITRARCPITSPSENDTVGVSANEYVYYFNNYLGSSSHGAIFRYESIT